MPPTSLLEASSSGNRIMLNVLRCKITPSPTREPPDQRGQVGQQPLPTLKAHALHNHSSTQELSVPTFPESQSSSVDDGATAH